MEKIYNRDLRSQDISQIVLWLKNLLVNFELNMFSRAKILCKYSKFKNFGEIK